MSDTDKRCFCISAKNGDMDAIVKHLKNNTIIDVFFIIIYKCFKVNKNVIMKILKLLEFTKQ